MAQEIMKMSDLDKWKNNFIRDENKELRAEKIERKNAFSTKPGAGWAEVK